MGNTTTVMMLPPVREGYAVRCPGTDGRKSHVFYIATMPQSNMTYRCAKCHPFMPLDRIAKDITKALKEEEKEMPPVQTPLTDKSIEELLNDLN